MSAYYRPKLYVASKRLKQSALMVESRTKSERERERERVPDCGTGN